jgi:hypothetical protein
LTPKLLVWILTGGIFLGCFSARADATPDDAIRQKLVQTILSEGQAQQKLLNELAESGAKVVHDVLTAWTRDGVYLYDGPDGAKVPILWTTNWTPKARRAPSVLLTASSSRMPAAKSFASPPLI